MPFWRVQHLPRDPRGWGADVRPEHVHLVTVPPSGAPHDLLWQRFAGVVGLDPHASYAESSTHQRLDRRRRGHLRAPAQPGAGRARGAAGDVRRVGARGDRQGRARRPPGLGAGDRAAAAGGPRSRRSPPSGARRSRRPASTWSATSPTSTRSGPTPDAAWANPDLADPVAGGGRRRSSRWPTCSPASSRARAAPAGPGHAADAAVPRLMATTGEQTYEQAVAALGATTSAPAVRRPGPTSTRRRRRRRPLQPLPDAVHLELVRRINLRGLTGSGTPRLADLVLSTSAPGRGLVDVPLPWSTPPRFGSPPIAPEQVPDEELIRLAVGVLARLLPGVPPPSAAPDLARWPMPWRRRFRLYGSPVTVEAVRRQLLRPGSRRERLAPGARRGRPADRDDDGRALGRAQRCRRTAALVDAVASRGGRRRPAAPDRRRRHRRAAGLHVRAAAGIESRCTWSSADGPRRCVAARRRRARRDAGPHRRRSRRRQHRPAATAQPAHHRHPGSRRHVRRLAADPGRRARPRCPRAPSRTRRTSWARAAWAQAAAAAAVGRIGEAGYAVHGDPRVLAHTEAGLPGTVDHRHTLEVAVEACLRTWRLQEGPS